MSRISSLVEAVEALEFKPLPAGKKIQMKAAVRVKKTFVFVDARGNIYSTEVQNRCYYTLNSRLDDTLEGCRVLGLLSREAVKKHTEAVRSLNAKCERFYAARNLLENAKELGLRLTKAQQTAITTAREEYESRR